MKRKILVTGASGLVGVDLVPALQAKVGKENVITYELQEPSKPHDHIFELGDIRDRNLLESVIQKHGVTEVYHLAGLLSVGGEKDPDLAWDVNLGSLRSVLFLAVKHKLKVFWPSSIAVFGSTTPKQHVPQHTILEPLTIYGVTKVTGELLCQYYATRYGVDVRSLRYPGLLGYKAPPGDGTTEYAIQIFYEAIKKNHYECYINRGTILPMMYMDDAIKGTIDLMEAPAEKISVRMGYNFSAIEFEPEELVGEINRHNPNFKCDYKPDSRQKIADSWPQTIDDSKARTDWGWSPSFDLRKMSDVMYEGIRRKLNE
ncbi:MAG: putative epimerase/dehydratase [Chlamydiae bacterium]|nr:putative epimerase/dehydratase [Chlamydiota bacterium]